MDFKSQRQEHKSSYLDQYEPGIRNFLNNKSKTFSYKSMLYRYMKDMYGLECAESSFRRYLSKHKEFDDYFHSVRHKHPGGPTISRYETGMGEQAQLYWEESLSFLLCTGEVIVINIFVLILSYSRFRVYQL